MRFTKSGMSRALSCYPDGGWSSGLLPGMPDNAASAEIMNSFLKPARLGSISRVHGCYGNGRYLLSNALSVRSLTPCTRRAIAFFIQTHGDIMVGDITDGIHLIGQHETVSVLRVRNGITLCHMRPAFHIVFDQSG